MSIADVEYRQQLASHVINSRKLADWIYHDVRLDCDNESNKRTRDRFKTINDNHGRDIMFGITGWWAIRSYQRLQEAHELAEFNHRPEFLPTELQEITDSDATEEQKRAHISAQQFMSTMTHKNEETAKAIFDAAYDAGVENYVALMYAVLVLSIRNSSIAERIKGQVYVAKKAQQTE